MKKLAITFVSACMLLGAGSAAYAAAPMTDKKHEHKMHPMKKMNAKSHGKGHKIHAKSHTKMHKLNAKSAGPVHKLHAKDVSDMPKTGFGGASGQAE